MSAVHLRSAARQGPCVAVALVVLAILVTASGTMATAATAPSSAPNPPAAGRPKIELNFWNWWDTWRTDIMNEVIASFEKEYPWIKINNQVQPWSGRESKLVAAFAAGTPPDILMATRAEVINLADQGLITPFTPFIKKYGLDLRIFFRFEIDAFRWEGEIWTLPFPTVSGNDDFYVYNRTLFEEAGLPANKPPRTWSDLAAAGRKLTRKRPDGRISQLGLRWTGPQFFPLLYSNSGQFLSDSLKSVTFDSPEGEETLRYMVQYVHEVNGGVAGQDQFSRDVGGGWGDPFYRGMEAIFFENVSVFSAIKQKAAPDFSWGVGMMPYNEKNPKAKSTGVAGMRFGWGYVIPASLPKEKQEAAYLFVQYLTTRPEGSGYFALKMGRPSPVIDLNRNPEFLKSNPNWPQVLLALDTDVVFPAVPGFDKMYNAARAAVDRALAGNLAAEVALKQGAEEVQKLLSQYWSSRKR